MIKSQNDCQRRAQNANRPARMKGDICVPKRGEKEKDKKREGEEEDDDDDDDGAEKED